MARSTGPILAVGALTVGNESIAHGRPIDWRKVIATGIAATLLSVLERGNEQLAVGVAWVALVTVMFARVQPGVPSPAESFRAWWEKGGTT